MNDYFSRGEIPPVERSATRAPSAVSAAQPISVRAPLRQNGAAGIAASPMEDIPEGSGLASSAEYARVHQRIADIMADLRSQSSSLSVEDAAEEIQAMLPSPTVLVPLPPASKEAVESSIRIAKRIAEQASYAHAAQANVHRGTVDQIVTPVA